MAGKLTDEQLAQIKQFLDTLPEEQRQEKFDEIVQELGEKEQQAGSQCPFCLMSEGKLKTVNIFEDSLFLAVLEINPANKGHLLIIPRRHIASITQLGGKEFEELTILIKNLAISLKTFNEAVNILIADGKAAGQRVEHLVIQIIPRMQGDKVVFSWQPKQAEEKELQEVKEKILANIPKLEPVQRPEPEKPIDNKKILNALFEQKRRRP
ncbi:HIT domain-containing protein [Candidatus Woesearchaeota archaeon]|nr:HIT domain-containing protein [Candidatus Woesearchaeota archaeon]